MDATQALLAMGGWDRRNASAFAIMALNDDRSAFVIETYSQNGLLLQCNGYSVGISE
jgi:hypothetical protein